MFKLPAHGTEADEQIRLPRQPRHKVTLWISLPDQPAFFVLSVILRHLGTTSATSIRDGAVLQQQNGRPDYSPALEQASLECERWMGNLCRRDGACCGSGRAKSG
ncbi:hypothetical protein MCOR25_008827 [Pyricularia grisea]|nr:hypothetical protein MCOR25_008827 [Pyricularia grisea]